MIYFALIDDNNIVQKIINVSDENITNPETNEVDPLYGETFCNENYGGRWISTFVVNLVHDDCSLEQCRKYARIGDSYDEDLDAFISPQPYPSWTLDDRYEWIPPISEPLPERNEVPEGKHYEWNEELYQSDNTQGWVLCDCVSPALEKLQQLGLTREDLKQILGL